MDKETKKGKGEQKFAAAAAAAATIEAIPDCVCITDFNANIIGVNKAMEDLFEVSRERLLKMHAFILITEQDIPKAGGAIQKLIQTGIPQQVELTGNLGKAKGRPFWMNMSLLKDGKENPTAIVAVTRDITKLKKLQEEAAKTKEATILDAMIDGVIVLDVNGNIIRCNSALAKMHGFKTREEMEGINISVLVVERDLQMAMNEVKNTFESGISVNFECTGKSKTGKEFPALINASVLKDEKEKILGGIGVVRDITEIKRLQEEAAKTKETTILEAMIDGVVVIDMNGNIVQCNSAYVKMYGFKIPEEMKGINLSELVAERDVKKVINDVKSCFEVGTSINFEHTSKDKAGKEFPVMVNASVLKDEKGKILGGIGVVRDITEIKKMEIKYSTIVRTAMDGFWITDLNGKFLEVNDAYCRMIGYSSEELLNMRVQDIEAAENPEEIARHTKKVVETGSDRFETCHRRKDGNILDMEISVNYVKEAGEKLYVFARDITERKRANDALSKINRCFLSFGSDINANIMKIIETTESIFEGACVLYNKEEGAFLCTIEGWNIPEDFKRKDSKEGHICYDVITKYRNVPLLINDLDKTPYAKTDPNVTKYNLKTYLGFGVKVGDEIIGSLCVVFQKNRTFNSNELNFFSLLARAIGIEEERKKIEQEIMQSEKMAGIGQLSAGVAHEFNNLLNIMGGSVEYAQGVKDKDEVKKSLDVVVKSINRGAQIVRNLLAFSRKIEPKKESADLAEVLEEVIGLVERDLEKSSIKITRNYLDTPKTIIDVGQIQQVFLNLILNAKNAMPKGGELTINLGKENKFIKIQFHNTGNIIEKEDLPRLFTPFFMTSKRQKVGMPGTGMGLAVSYGIIQLHNGEIKAESAKGKGTTITIRLPLTKNKDMVAILPKRAAKAVKTVRRRLKHAEILIVDDEVEMGRLYKKALDKEGYSVTVADNGKDALDLYRKRKFDLIYLDIVMPGMDGISIFKKIKKVAPETKIVMLTGKLIEDKVAEMCLSEGAAGFLRKPITLRELVSYTHNIVTK